MTSASGYPKTIDTDTELLRRIASDAMLPEDHNNLVDALEQIEIALGRCGDGSEGGGAAAYLSTLMDYVGFPSTAMPNPKLPWDPVSTYSWYSRARVTPAAWTIGGSATLSYTARPGYATLDYSGGAPGLVASMDVPAGLRWDMVCRIFADADLGFVGEQFFIGASASGSGSDCTGMRTYYSTGIADTMRAIVNGGDTVAAVTFNMTPQLGPVWFHYTATDCTMYQWATYGGWHQIGPVQTLPGTPTKLGIWQHSNPGARSKLTLDFIAFGQTDPAGV